MTDSCHCGDPATLTTTSQRQMCAPCAYSVHETCTCSCPYHSDQRQPGSISGPKPYPCTCGSEDNPQPALVFPGEAQQHA